MRTISTANGYSVIVSNQEYTLIRHITAKGKVLNDSLEEYYQELAEKLANRGLLNKVQDGDEIFFVPIKKE